MQEIFDRKTDALEDLLDLGDLSRGLETQNSKAEDIDSLEIHEVRDKINERAGWVNSMHVEISGELEEVKDVKNAIEKREESEEFKDNKEMNAVDAADYNRLKELISYYERIIPRLAISEKILRPTSMQLYDMLELQQLRHDESRIIETIEKHEDSRENRINEMFDHTKNMMQDSQQDLKETVGQVQQVTDNLGSTIDSLQDVIQKVSEQSSRGGVDEDELHRLVEKKVEERMQEMQPPEPSPEQAGGEDSTDPSDPSSGRADDGDVTASDLREEFDIPPHRAEIYYYSIIEGDSNNDIASKVSMSPQAVGKALNSDEFEMVEKVYGDDEDETSEDEDEDGEEG